MTASIVVKIISSISGRHSQQNAFQICFTPRKCNRSYLPRHPSNRYSRAGCTPARCSSACFISSRSRRIVNGRSRQARLVGHLLRSATGTHRQLPSSAQQRSTTSRFQNSSAPPMTPGHLVTPCASPNVDHPRTSPGTRDSRSWRSVSSTMRENSPNRRRGGRWTSTTTRTDICWPMLAVMLM